MYKCKLKDYFTQNTQKKYVFEIVAIKIIEAKAISNFQKRVFASDPYEFCQSYSLQGLLELGDLWECFTFQFYFKQL